MSNCNFKTGEDVNLNITISIKDKDGVTIPITNFVQIIIVLYYIRNGSKVKFSWHALDILEAAIVAEAISEGITLNDFNLNGDIAELTIPKEETDTLTLDVGESVQVLFDLSVTDNLGKHTKKQGDAPVGSMVKSIVEGLL